MQAIRMGESTEPQTLILPDNVPGLLRVMAAEFKCSICLMVMTDPMSTVCNHMFCRDCIHRALATKDTCPLCNTHITRRGLNPIEHLSKLIDCFNTMREAYEAETDTCLSQAPRQSWTKEPQENLSQLYPYPEKNQSTSSKPQKLDLNQRQQSTQSLTPAIARPARAQVPNTQTPEAQPAQVRETKALHRSTQSPQHESISMDQDELSCFDMNLDLVSAEEQSWLAEQMIRLVSQLSLGSSVLDEAQDDILTQVEKQEKRLREQKSTAVPSRPSTLGNSATASQRMSRAVRRSASLQPDDSEGRSDLHYVKEEPSEERNISLSVTSLSPKMKQSVQRVAKMLNTPIIEGFGEGPTHVVTQTSPESGFKGKGRTIKYFLCILRGCWMVNYSWVEASSRAGYWVKEDSHQAADNEFGNNGPKRSRASHSRGEPKLLDGYTIQLYGKFTVPSRADLELLIEAGGGKVVEDLLVDGETNGLAAVKVEKDDSVTPALSSSHVIQPPPIVDDHIYVKQEPEENGEHLILSAELPPTQLMESVRRRLLLFDADKISKRGQDQVLDALRDLRSRAQTLTADQALRPGFQYRGVHSIDLVACSNLLDCITQYDMAQLTPLSVD